MVVNVPLALGFAWLVSFVYRPAFEASFILGYWLTNVLGLVLMHRGGEAMLGKVHPYSRGQLVRDFGIALGYTVLILILVRWKILSPLVDLQPPS